MPQNRDAPAYQEYAATMLSKLEFRTLALHERGLLYTMRLECWVNHKLPSDAKTLARVLGLPADDVECAMESVMPFFALDGASIVCPELDDYREHLAERKRKQSEGGKRGSAKTNARKKKATARELSDDSSTPASTLQVPRRGRVESLVQSSTEKHSQNQLTGKDVSDLDEWDKEYDNAESF